MTSGSSGRLKQEFEAIHVPLILLIVPCGFFSLFCVSISLIIRDILLFASLESALASPEHCYLPWADPNEERTLARTQEKEKKNKAQEWNGGGFFYSRSLYFLERSRQGTSKESRSKGSRLPVRFNDLRWGRCSVRERKPERVLLIYEDLLWPFME